jgi:hypothetical protein
MKISRSDALSAETFPILKDVTVEKSGLGPMKVGRNRLNVNLEIRCSFKRHPLCEELSSLSALIADSLEGVTLGDTLSCTTEIIGGTVSSVCCRSRRGAAPELVATGRSWGACTKVCLISFRCQAITYEYGRGDCHPANANLLQSRSKIAPCALYS